MYRFREHNLRVLSALATMLCFHLWAVCGCTDSSSVPADVGTSEELHAMINRWQPDAPVNAWKFIVIHHTATDSGSVESIDEAHRVGNAWQGIGYHFLIGNGHGMADGEVAATFRWQEQIAGAHAGNRQYNEFGIGVCLVGNFEEQPPTPAQLDAVRRLVGWLKGEFRLEQEQVLGHRDVKATACPGRHFPLDEVASARPIGDSLAIKERGRRFTPVTAARDKEGIRNVASIRRSMVFRGRSAPGGNDER